MGAHRIVAVAKLNSTVQGWAPSTSAISHSWPRCQATAECHLDGCMACMAL